MVVLAQGDEVEEVVQVLPPDPLGIEVDWQKGPAQLGRDPALKEVLVVEISTFAD